MIGKDLANFANQLVPITIDQYEGMIRTGIVAETSSVELLDGLLVRKDRSAGGEDVMTVGNDHVFGVESLQELRDALAALGLSIRLQQPIQIPPYNEPEPDGAIVRGTRHAYKDRKPRPTDITGVIEVADTSLNFDRTTKLGIYASAGIEQYVILNMVDHVVEVYTSPDPLARGYARQEIVPRQGVVRFHVGEGRMLDRPASEFLP